MSELILWIVDKIRWDWAVCIVWGMILAWGYGWVKEKYKSFRRMSSGW